MPKCSQCPHEAETLGQLRRHHKDAGHPQREKPPRSPRAERASRGSRGRNVHRGSTSETALLSKCSELFDDAHLDEKGCQRVLDYLIARYYPNAVEETTEEEAA